MRTFLFALASLALTSCAACPDGTDEPVPGPDKGQQSEKVEKDADAGGDHDSGVPVDDATAQDALDQE